LHIYDDNPPAADISCVSSMNSNLGTLQYSVNPSEMSSITHNTNQNHVAPLVILPLTFISFAKKDTKKQAIKYVDTEYGHTIAPNLSSIPQLQKIDHLSNKMSEIREDVIQSGKKTYAQDVQYRASNFHIIKQDNDARLDSIVRSCDELLMFDSIGN
jgi:protein-disulfide isomerase